MRAIELKGPLTPATCPVARDRALNEEYVTLKAKFEASRCRKLRMENRASLSTEVDYSLWRRGAGTAPCSREELEWQSSLS